MLHSLIEMLRYTGGTNECSHTYIRAEALAAAAAAPYLETLQTAQVYHS